MRKLLFAFAIILSANIVDAQIANHAIGLRLGGGDGFGTEISYQHGLNDLNRLEFDLGMHNGNHYNAWGLAGIYQWVWNIDGGFNCMPAPVDELVHGAGITLTQELMAEEFILQLQVMWESNIHSRLGSR